MNALLKAINRQMKTDKSALKNSTVPITLSVEDHADDLFNDPSEESEFMQGSARGDTEQFCLVMKMILCWMSWRLSPCPRPISISVWKLVCHKFSYPLYVYVGVMLCSIRN